ncbi:MAG: MBL fold metallo-hydrolase [Caldilineaceae bacterium]|nr:MBL fold metallo-hydrolase [Caldilineaceae bacterium]
MGVIQVAEHIYQVRLPLPFRLDHVNCYALRDDDGWTLVDAGLHWPDAEAAWRAAWAELDLQPRQIRRMILTHAHPDHFGMAGWVQAQSSAPVYLAAEEETFARRMWMAPAMEVAASAQHWRSAGAPEDVIQRMEAQTDHLQRMTLPHPTALATIEAGITVQMGGRKWQAIHAPGHSEGQLLFYAASDRLLLCGDHVLMKITPHIGLWPTSAPDPLGRYLASLDALAGLEVQLALPGHRHAIHDWPGRIAELQQHHAERLTTMAESADGATAFQVMERAFPAGLLSEHELRFALAETLAHLEHLVIRRQLNYDDGGVRVYHRRE